MGREVEMKRVRMPAPDSPHIIVIVVIELNVVAKGRVSVLLVAWAVSLAIFIALLVAPRMATVAIMRIVIIVIHGRFVIGTFSVVLLPLRLCESVSNLARPQDKRIIRLPVGIADIADTHLADPVISMISGMIQTKQPTSAGASVVPWLGMST